ncbi:MAG: hypothetical protein M5U01_38340 [Ardenticatenaceae bacterium]|nr:hypothetical protein [Ardenticatenaceae bacterium]HBY97367.1 hypothetical protein [Chloroflexota bacterium]
MHESEREDRRKRAGASQRSLTFECHTVIRRVGVTVGIVVLAAVALALVRYAASVLLLVFGGILVAVFLRGLSDRLSARTPLSEE